MSYVPRAYPDIVRDMLTTLTRGVVRETVAVPGGEDPVLLLTQRPVRRVSHLQGRVSIGRGDQAHEVDYRFTTADFQLVSSKGDGQLDAIGFRPGGRRPAPLSTMIVNYYPVLTDPVPVTDLNVGSVVRTLVESIAYELALAYEHLRHVYDSAFLDTATGPSLDKVVALVGVTRLPAGHPVATLRFTRRPDVPGRITVPASTPVVDDAGNRYLTTDELILEPGEQARTVTARGDSTGTLVVGADALNRPEVVIGGVLGVTNPDPARALTGAESDEELRRRARRALHGVVRGTPDALRFALLSIDGVRDVTLAELPHGVPGEVAVTVAYGEDTPGVHAKVKRVIREVRPAGIRVVDTSATPQRVGVDIRLTVAGAVLPQGAELDALRQGVVERVTGLLRSLGPGGRLRRAPLAAAVLAEPRLVDAVVTLLPQGGAPADEYQLAEGAVLDVGTVRVVEIAPEIAAAAPPTTSTVALLLPLHLVAGVNAADAHSALGTAVDAYLATVTAAAPLTVDALLAAVRDDTRYAIVRADALVTVTAGDRFLQLTDGAGSYAPGPGETLVRSALDLDVREGAV